VLNALGLGKSPSEARQRAYEILEQVHFKGMHFRKDIAL
ncbi:hypothetical protein HY009_04465, partial [Candidatus Acetothermia bacterium]|nr:hypothetical protein [Candidatus Acetothermia bacterium]